MALPLGLTIALNNPSHQAFVPELVGNDQVTNALDSLQYNLACVLRATVGHVTVTVRGVAGTLFPARPASCPRCSCSLGSVRPTPPSIASARAVVG